MIVTRIPPLPPPPVKTAAELFQHLPKALLVAENERQAAEEKLSRITAREQAATAMAIKFSEMVARRERVPAA